MGKVRNELQKMVGEGIEIVGTENICGVLSREALQIALKELVAMDGNPVKVLVG
jgi:hypothetical protein